MIKNIVFDWSGTLSNDHSCVYQATMNVFERIGIPKLTFEEYKREFTLPYMEFYKKFTDKPRKLLDDLFSEEISVVKEPVAYPNVNEILEYLHQNSVGMVILTSHIPEKLKKEIRDYGFGQYFQGVYSGVLDKIEELPRILKKHDWDPINVAYVGDMPHDIETGKSQNLLTIASLYGYETKERLLPFSPDYFIEDIKELPQILEKIKDIR